MGCKAGQCKTSTPKGIFVVTPSLEGWPTKTKEAPSPHEVSPTQYFTNTLFQCLRENYSQIFKMRSVYWLINSLKNTTPLFTKPPP